MSDALDSRKAALEKLMAAYAPKERKETIFTKFYNFWKMADGETAIVRFIRDANLDNPRQFLVENLTHTLMINGKKRIVACLEMYGEKCPICEKSRQYYSEAEAAGEPKPDQSKGIQAGPLTALGKKYYRKKEFLGQVVVQGQSPIEYEKNDGHDAEMPISIGPQIFKLIQTAFASGDLEEVPFEVKGGYDFRIKKSKQGTNANYTTSSFSPKQSDLSDDTIAQLNPYDLSTLRNRKQDRATLEAMLIAEQTGQPLQLPGKEKSEESDTMNFVSKAGAESVTTPVVSEEVTTPATSEATPNKVNDVLAQIRQRAAANKAAGG